MNKLDNVYAFADECSIDIVDDKFSNTKKAVCMHITPDKVIFIDKPSVESDCEEVSILAEEIGHFETGALYIITSTHNTPIARANRIKYEAKARHWAFKKYLPPHEIAQAIEHEGSDDYAIAEYCSVTVCFLRDAIEYYQSLGVKFEVGAA